MRNAWLNLTIICVVLALFGCSKHKEQKPKAPPIKVVATKVERGDLAKRLHVSGPLRFIANTTVSSEVAAQVKSIEVNDGQAGMTETNTLHGLPAEAIRAAVILYSGHSHQCFRIDGSGSICVYKSSYATHNVLIVSSKSYQVNALRIVDNSAMRIKTAPRAWAKYQLCGVSSSSRASSCPRARGCRIMASDLSGDDLSRRY